MFNPCRQSVRFNHRPSSSSTLSPGLDLSVSPGITARCGSHVRLQCMATSSRSGLSIKHIGWYHRNTPVCYVDNQGPILFNQTDHYCEYEDGQLSLTFPKLKPYQEGRDLESYLCKLRSNQEVKHKYTSVELDGESSIYLCM